MLIPIPLLGACARGTDATTGAAVAVATPATEPTPVTPAASATPPEAIAVAEPVAAASAVAPTTSSALPLVVMHRDPDCGCCEAWAKHMRRSGFTVEIRDEPELEKLKKQLGIPDEKASCHTAEVDGYVIEGHVPAEDVKRLLAEHPKARGLALPGMPAGSPGMGEDRPHPAYTVELLAEDGQAKTYAVHPAK